MVIERRSGEDAMAIDFANPASSVFIGTEVEGCCSSGTSTDGALSIVAIEVALAGIEAVRR